MTTRSPQQAVYAVICWTARSLSVGLFMLFAAITLGEGPPPLWPLSTTTLLFALLGVAFTALLTAWRWHIAGSLIALASIAGFYAVEWVESDFTSFPSGWFLPLTAMTAVLYLLATRLESDADGYNRLTDPRHAR